MPLLKISLQLSLQILSVSIDKLGELNSFQVCN